MIDHLKQISDGKTATNRSRRRRSRHQQQQRQPNPLEEQQSLETVVEQPLFVGVESDDQLAGVESHIVGFRRLSAELVAQGRAGGARLVRHGPSARRHQIGQGQQS